MFDHLDEGGQLEEEQALVGAAVSCLPPCRFRSSKFMVLGLPVVEVVAASSAGGRLESGARLMALARPFTRSSIETLRPLRGKKP